jgi:hypothetical protein
MGVDYTPVDNKQTVVQFSECAKIDEYPEIDLFGYMKTAKANDLEEYFEIKAVKFQDLSGKWVHGLELLSKK